MNVQETAIKASFALLSKFNNRFNKNQRESEDTLKDWAAFLSQERKFTVTQIGFALTHLMKGSPRFMPSAYEIADVLVPKAAKAEDRAPIIANEMIKAVQLYGSYDEERMLKAVSDDARECFLAYGSTKPIRDSEDPEILKAQLERFIKGVLRSKEFSAHNTDLKKVGIISNEMKSLNFTQFLPKDPA